MDSSKAWYQSRTIWGALIAVFAPLFSIAGLDLPAGMEGELAEGLVTVAGGIGGLIALYGRLSATRAIR
ncbi:MULTISPECIES: hypothetical protein [unclassified Agrobacterium]|nr:MULTISPECIES: hypothetical protein [unclassified Agrobacterium]MDH0615336.1 hypothetical protein [Agrobacterium sp. GD03872]MDH0698383.1 hypothetical protein [Agrobacterium sp. GD03871]MDH1060562.1 hypothetical protein [Agrobacterium sp. GD03992]MDH2213764.1 hypothetical protein [Agrobacterium sp. GD03643]MDH2220925.1 hypothetical protein [Agrobacterium sp. GD03638]